MFIPIIESSLILYHFTTLIALSIAKAFLVIVLKIVGSQVIAKKPQICFVSPDIQDTFTHSLKAVIVLYMYFLRHADYEKIERS